MLLTAMEMEMARTKERVIPTVLVIKEIHPLLVVQKMSITVL